MLMKKNIDFQSLTFFILATERNTFRVSGIATNESIYDGRWRV